MLLNFHCLKDSQKNKAINAPSLNVRLKSHKDPVVQTFVIVFKKYNEFLTVVPGVPFGGGRKMGGGGEG